jgi:hypothetical protein
VFYKVRNNSNKKRRPNYLKIRPPFFIMPEMRLFELERSGDQIDLVADAAQFGLVSGKTQNVNGRIARFQKIIPAAHIARRSDEFEIENPAVIHALKIFFLSGNVTGQKLQPLFLVADHVGHHLTGFYREFADLEMPVLFIAVNIFDVRTLIGHDPVEKVFFWATAETLRISPAIIIKMNENLFSFIFF